MMPLVTIYNYFIGKKNCFHTKIGFSYFLGKKKKTYFTMLLNTSSTLNGHFE
jgi:hypothetical protein